MAKILYMILLLSLVGCGLNNVDTPLGELKGGQNNDPDYFVNLWPEAIDHQPNPVLEGELKTWPVIDKTSVLYVGDSSLIGNWGLAIQKTFEEEGAENLTLVGCDATAVNWKNGLAAHCLYTAPFKKFTDKPIYLTQDMTSQSERALPLILAHEQVSKIVLSFGHYLKDIADSKGLQEELVAIEILAKWAHSTGKSCYYVSPSGEFFLESGVQNVAPEILNRLKVIIEPYCYWVDALETRQTFLEETQIKVEEKVLDIGALPTKVPDEEYIRIDEAPAVVVPELPPLVLPDLSLDTSGIPQIIEDKRKVSPKAEEELVIPIPRPRPETQNEESIPKEDAPSKLTEDPKVKETPTQTTEEESLVAQELRALEGKNIPIPQPRPQFLKEADQQAIRTQIEASKSNVAKVENKALKFQEPKYLWNGYKQGSTYTKIGKEELERYGKSMFETSKLSDATSYCPNYWNLSKGDRKNVWLFLYSTLALYESTFNPGAKGVEVSGGTSVGLFQMNYDNCKQSASKASDMTDTRVNFRCAIRKSAHLVEKGSQIANGSYPSNCNRQGCSYQGGAMDRYWSTLRKPYKAKMQSRGKIVEVTVGKRPQVIKHLKGLPHCKK